MRLVDRSASVQLVAGIVLLVREEMSGQNKIKASRNFILKQTGGSYYLVKSRVHSSELS